MSRAIADLHLRLDIERWSRTTASTHAGCRCTCCATTTQTIRRGSFSKLQAGCASWGVPGLLPSQWHSGSRGLYISCTEAISPAAGTWCWSSSLSELKRDHRWWKHAPKLRILQQQGCHATSDRCAAVGCVNCFSFNTLFILKSPSWNLSILDWLSSSGADNDIKFEEEM